MVVIFTAVVTLKGFDCALELVFNKCGKMKKFVKHVGFMSKGVDPYVVSIMIKKNDIIFNDSNVGYR